MRKPVIPVGLKGKIFFIPAYEIKNCRQYIKREVAFGRKKNLLPGKFHAFNLLITDRSFKNQSGRPDMKFLIAYPLTGVIDFRGPILLKYLFVMRKTNGLIEKFLADQVQHVSKAGAVVFTVKKHVQDLCFSNQR